MEPIFRYYALNGEVEVLLEEIATDFKNFSNFLTVHKLFENEGEKNV